MEQEKINYFISDRKDHDPLIYKSTKITVLKEPCQADLLDQWLTGTAFASLDTEFNGNRIYINELLLVQIGDKHTRFVIDCGSGLWEYCKAIINKHSERVLFFVMSGKGDIKLLYCDSVYIEKVLDILILEQRIHLGRTDLDHDLAAIVDRHLHKYLDKGQQASFLSMTRKSKFHITQIIYAANDVEDLIDIARSQRTILQSTNQYDWFLEVEFPLTTVLAEMELEGIKCYGDKWKEIIKLKNQEIREQNLSLNQLVLTHYQAEKPQLVAIDLFGTATLVEKIGKKKKGEGNINFNSPQQVQQIFERVDSKVPMFKEKNQPAKPSAREAAIQQYLIDNPSSKLKKFALEYLNFKELKKFISSYGEKFLYSEVRKDSGWEPGYLNPFTQLVHTIFKQCSTDTGRLASGDVENGYYNCQNIPRKKEIRQGFGLTEEEIAAGYWLTTCDLSGAEATIMAAFADEQYMYELAIIKDDVHSPIATDCWKAVYQYRIERNRDLTVKDSEHKVYTLTEDFLIDKDHNKGLRTDFKNFTFGAIYGMKDNKGAQTLNVPKDEAQIMINTIKRKFPKIFKMVEEAEQCAFADGYVILNSVSNNRRWFTPVISLHKQLGIEDRTKRYYRTKQELNYGDIAEIQGQARNVRIQGTQSDMVKESMIVLRKELFTLSQKYNMGNWNISSNRFGQQKLSIHDELCVKHKGKEYGDRVAEIMTTVANKYLKPYSTNIRMKCEYSTGYTWTK